MLGVSYLCHCSSERTGRRCTGNESEDLQNKVEKLSIRGKWAVRKWFKIIFIYSMSGRTKVLLVCAVSLGASILRLSAQEVGGDTITGKVHQIEKVTVTARRSPNKVTSAVPIQTMSRQDISSWEYRIWQMLYAVCRSQCKGLWRHWRTENGFHTQYGSSPYSCQL